MKKGLDKFFDNDFDNDWFVIKDGEKKSIRFTEEVPNITVARQHFVKTDGFKGFVFCLNDPDNDITDECPLCEVASTEWNDPITVAKKYFFTKIIDREDGKVKLFKGTSGISQYLIKHYQDNDSIVNIDFNISRKKKGNLTQYNLSGLVGSIGDLKEDEKKKVAELDLDKNLSFNKKTKKEMQNIINSLEDKNNNSDEEDEDEDSIL